MPTSMLPLLGPGLGAERNGRGLEALSLPPLLRLRGLCGTALPRADDIAVRDGTRDVSGNRSGVTGDERKSGSVKLWKNTGDINI